MPVPSLSNTVQDNDLCQRPTSPHGLAACARATDACYADKGGSDVSKEIRKRGFLKFGAAILLPEEDSAFGQIPGQKKPLSVLGLTVHGHLDPCLRP